MSDNVIDFRARREQRLAEAIEVRKRKIEELAEREDFIADFAMGATIDIVEASYEFGFDVTQDPIAIRDIMMLMESVSSLLNRIKGERTAFHDVTDGVFTWDERKCEEVLQDFLQDTEIFT